MIHHYHNVGYNLGCLCGERGGGFQLLKNMKEVCFTLGRSVV